MKTILFACTENRKRSKLAEAIFNHLAREMGIDAQAKSAGTIPAREAEPAVERILAERNIVFSIQKPQKLTDEMLQKADHIVSFGCLIPDMFPKEKFEEWQVSDPETQEDYQAAFQTIYERVEKLLSRWHSRP